MKKSAVPIFAGMFWILTIIDIAGILSGCTLLHSLAKPTLMPMLLLLLIFSGTTTGRKGLVIAALILSFLGDVMLLFENKGPLFFIAGLTAFLFAHACYIFYFLNVKSSGPSLITKQPWMAALAAAYGVSLIRFLLPGLGDLTIPVIIYAIVICTMMICSMHVFLKVIAPANYLFVAGALFFTASDSMLAINKFFKPFASAGVLIMLTYCAAQFCIVSGVVKRK